MDPFKLSEPPVFFHIWAWWGIQWGETRFLKVAQARNLGFLLSLPLFPIYQSALMILPVKSKWIHLLFFNSASVLLDRSLALLSWFTHLLMAVSALFPVIFILYTELTFKNINQPCHSLPKTHQWLNILLIIKPNILTLAYKPLMAWPPPVPSLPTLPLALCTGATWLSVSGTGKFIPTSGPGHQLFPLPALHYSWLLSFHVTASERPFLDTQLKVAPSPIILIFSS